MKWFRHMTNASDDEFLSEVEEIFGLEGYARWWKMLEVIASQMDGSNKCSASYSWTKWQSFLKGKRNKLETFLKHLQNKQKINLEENGNILKIECRNLLKMRDEYSRKSGQTPDGCPDKVAPEEDTEVDIVSTGTNVPSTADAAPPENPPVEIDFKKIIFTDGLVWLSQRTGKPPDKLRSLVGGWCKYGDHNVAAAIIQAQKESAVDPVAYITKILGGGSGKSGKHTGFDKQDYYAGTEGFDVV